jgi:hypothetical protein
MWLVLLCLKEDHILRVIDSVEIKETCGNDKEKGTGSQTNYRSRMNDITALFLEGFSPRHGNKLSVGRFSRVN